MAHGLAGRTSCNPVYHDPHPKALHSHPHHRDPEYDHRIEQEATRLWVVTAVSNPERYKTRYALYKRFRYHITRECRIHLLTVEVAHGERDHQLTDDDLEESVVQGCTEDGVRTIDVRVRNKSHIWLKENMWNVGAKFLPNDCKYVLFADADLHFLNDHFATEVVHALQHWRVVQPFETAADMGPNGQIMDVHRSFGWCHAHGWEWRPRPDGHGGYHAKRPEGVPRHEGFGTPWHPGYALGMRRAVLDRLPILEVGALGAGDHHMMGALIGKAELTVPSGIHAAYREEVLMWQARASQVVNHDLGYVPGTILHFFHGAKTNRRYVSRWEILVKHQFDPRTDVYRNSQGVMELEDFKPALRDAMRAYFKQRQEDGLDM